MKTGFANGLRGGWHFEIGEGCFTLAIVAVRRIKYCRKLPLLADRIP
jgi:hypothetical protein